MALSSCLPTSNKQDVVQDQNSATETVAVVQDTVTETVDVIDTIKVPDWLSGEDSIAYIENALIQSPISVETYLSLSKIHELENNLNNFNKQKTDDTWFGDEDYSQFIATHQDSCTLKLGNRIMRMHSLAFDKGDAMDKMQWTIAVNAAIDTFCIEMPDIPRDSALKDIDRVMYKFMDMIQSDWDYVSYVSSVLKEYQTIENYRQWINELPDDLMLMAQEEYLAWFQLNEERYAFWRDISSEQGQNSLKGPLQSAYYECLLENRKAELAIERKIVLNNKPYHQLGKKTTSQQWEKWLADNSVPVDIERCKEEGTIIPDTTMVKERSESLRVAYNRWLVTRQAFAAALPKAQGESYARLTSDLQSRFIGKLRWLVQYE